MKCGICGNKATAYKRKRRLCYRCFVNSKYKSNPVNKLLLTL